MIKIRTEDYEKLKRFVEDLIGFTTVESGYFSITQDKTVTKKELEDFLKQLY